MRQDAGVNAAFTVPASRLECNSTYGSRRQPLSDFPQLRLKRAYEYTIGELFKHDETTCVVPW